MDEAAVDRAGVTPLKAAPRPDRGDERQIQLPEVVASLQQMVRPANLNFIDAQYQGILFGILHRADFDDARVNIADHRPVRG